MALERPAKEGNSPVCENFFVLFLVSLEYLDKRMRRGNLPVRAGKAKYFSSPIVNKYREGTLKSSPARAMK